MKRFFMYILLILLAFMLQNNFFAAIKWIDTTPNLVLIITFVFGLLQGKLHGMLIGFFGGLLLDFFFGYHVGFYAFIYMAIGYANGLLAQFFYTEFLHMPIVLCIVNDLIFSLYVYVCLFLLNGATNFGYYLYSVILPEIVYTTIITLIVFKPLQKLDAFMEGLEKKSAKKFV